MSEPRASLHVSVRGGVADVELCGPGKGNAMGPDFWRECPAVFAELDRDDGVRAVVVRGRGGVFTYGIDLKAMAPEIAPHLADGNLARERQRLLDLIVEMQRACDAVEACRKPVIAAITGPCIGGGVDLACACDVRLASADARFSVREVRVAMVADMGSLQRLPRIVGQGIARELAFTGADVGAERALRIGLVNDVFDSHEALLAGARDMAAAIAENPPLVVQGVKQVMNRCAHLSVEDGQRYVALWNAAFLASHDLREAMTAFMEKRAPRFEGR
jgi:enoyl-CoA hydratase